MSSIYSVMQDRHLYNNLKEQLVKKKNELEAELLSAENPLQLIKTDYFSKVILELGNGVKLLRDQLVNTSSVFNTMLEKKAQEINDLIESYNGLLARIDLVKAQCVETRLTDYYTEIPYLRPIVHLDLPLEESFVPFDENNLDKAPTGSAFAN